MPIGLFQLKSPSDLLEKLCHDLERIRRNPLDQYAAFDFFVTAEHMVDWLFPTVEAERKKLRNLPLLALCSHIANGAKHFEAKAKHHNSFSDSQVHPGAFSSGFSSGFDISGLIVVLDGDAKLTFGSEIYVWDLAEKILRYWGPKIFKPSP